MNLARSLQNGAAQAWAAIVMHLKRRPFSPRFVMGATAIDEAFADLIVQRLLVHLTAIDLLERQRFAQMGAPLPLLYDAGVRYEKENYEGQHPEDWTDVVELYRQRAGDCEDLACARAAELQEMGEPAAAIFITGRRSDGSRLLHIVVRRGDGSIEDPSALLGMKGAA